MRNDKKTSGSVYEVNAAEGGGVLSRRDFIRVNLALLVLAGTSSCSWPDAPADDRNAFRILRMEDLLSLRFEHRWRKPARLVRMRPGQDAFVRVGFPGQHILEQAFPEGRHTDPIVLPATSRMARPSRLVFKIPPGRDPIDLTFDALLDWREWIPMLPEAGPDGRIAEASAAKTSSTQPSLNRSLVELPYGLMLSPNVAARWVHATRPVTHNGRTELWHTRLAPGRALTVKRTSRATWSLAMRGYSYGQSGNQTSVVQAQAEYMESEMPEEAVSWRPLGAAITLRPSTMEAWRYHRNGQVRIEDAAFLSPRWRRRLVIREFEPFEQTGATNGPLADRSRLICAHTVPI